MLPHFNIESHFGWGTFFCTLPSAGCCFCASALLGVPTLFSSPKLRTILCGLVGWLACIVHTHTHAACCSTPFTENSSRFYIILHTLRLLNIFEAKYIRKKADFFHHLFCWPVCSMLLSTFIFLTRIIYSASPTKNYSGWQLRQAQQCEKKKTEDIA